MRNTAYKVKVETVTSDEVSSVNIEQGGLLVTDEALFMGFNGEMVKVYPQTSESLGLGWARYDDTEYSSASSYAFTASTPFTIPNNALSKIETHIHSGISYYNGSKVFAEYANDVYILTIAFKSKITNANGYVELYLEGGNGTPYTRVSDMVVFPKGNNVEHTYTKQFQFYADSDVVTNGLSVKMLPSDDGEIYDVIYFIQRTQKHND